MKESILPTVVLLLGLSTWSLGCRQAIPQVSRGASAEDDFRAANLSARVIRCDNLSVHEVVEIIAAIEPAVTVEGSADSMILTGTDREVRTAAAVIAKLDSSDFDNSQIKIFKLQRADAQILANIIDEIGFSARRDHDEVNVIEVFRLEFANAKALAESLKRGWEPKLATRLGPNHFVAVAADERSNSLIVSVPSSWSPDIRDYLQKVDQPSDSERRIPIFQLDRQKLEQLSISHSDNNRKSLHDLFTFAAPRTHGLLVMAEPEILVVIEELISQLDATSPNPRR